jgi:hypothetical protein
MIEISKSTKTAPVVASRLRKSKIVGGSHTDKSGTTEVFGPPGMPPAYIIKPAYFFVIAGIDRKATEACAEYLASLARMLAEFKAAHP